MINKLIKVGNITELEKRIAGRLGRGQLLFGNRLQLAEIKILSLIREIKENEDYFQECNFCRDKFSIADLKEVEGDLICDNCISENYFSCENCGDLIYNENIKEFDGDLFCESCYFEVKQKAYKSHKIISHLLIKLAEVEPGYNLSEVEFKIEGNLWQIEIYSRGYYRLGSWGANSWVDIGSCKDDLIKAIDYNLGSGRDKLTAIYLDKNTEIKL